MAARSRGSRGGTRADAGSSSGRAARLRRARCRQLCPRPASAASSAKGKMKDVKAGARRAVFAGTSRPAPPRPAEVTVPWPSSPGPSGAALRRRRPRTGRSGALRLALASPHTTYLRPRAAAASYIWPLGAAMLPRELPGHGPPGRQPFKKAGLKRSRPKGRSTNRKGERSGRCLLTSRPLPGEE